MRHPYTIILSYIVTGLVLLFVSYQWGIHLIKLLIPLYEWTIKQLDYRFDTVTFSIIKQHGEQFLLLQTTYSMPIYAGNETLVPNTPIPSGATMPLGNVLLPFILVFTTVFAWPITDHQSKTMKYTLRVLLALPICLLLMLLDMPIQLLKIVWENLNRLLNLNISQNLYYFTYWSDFLNGGGLVALSIAAGILIVGLTDYLIKQDILYG
jgi:hypothetical protein